MALKYKLTKAAHAKLSEDLQGEYVEQDGAYVLDIDGYPAPENDGALKRAKDREKQRADEAEAEATRLQADLDEVRKNQGKGEKDVERLTKAHEKALEKAENEAAAKIEKLTKFIDKEVVGKTAEAIATKISTVPKLMSAEIGKRLAVNYDGDEPTLEIIGSDGKADAKLTLDKLGEEFVANKEFSAIIVGSKARGSGATPNNLPGSANSASPGDKVTDLATAPTTDLLAHVRSVREAANNGQQ